MSNFSYVLPRAIHKQPTFLEPELRLDQHASFLEVVSDLASGIGLCIELVYSSDFNRRAGHTPPLLDENDSERLARFAMAATRLLEQKTNQKIDALNDELLAKQGK